MLHILRPPSQHSIQQGAAVSFNTQQNSKSHPVWSRKKHPNHKALLNRTHTAAPRGKTGHWTLYESLLPVCMSEGNCPQSLCSATWWPAPWDAIPQGRCSCGERTCLSKSLPQSTSQHAAPQTLGSSHLTWLFVQRTPPLCLQCHVQRSPPLARCLLPSLFGAVLPLSRWLGPSRTLCRLLSLMCPTNVFYLTCQKHTRAIKEKAILQ